MIYHVYLTYSCGQTVFQTSRSQDEAFGFVWTSRAGLSDYTVYAVMSDGRFVDVTTIVADTIRVKENALYGGCHV